MQVTGKVEVDILHGHHLGITAAGRAALDTEHGAKAGLTQAEHGLFAQSVHGIGQAHAGGGLALACRGGADGRDQDHLALLGCLVDEAVVDLGLVAAIGDHILIGKAQRGSDLGDGLHFGFLCDLDIRLHAQILPEMQKGQLCAPIAQGCPDGRRKKPGSVCTVVLHNVPSAGKPVLLGQRYHICPWFVKQKLSAKKNLPVRPLRLASILPDVLY